MLLIQKDEFSRKSLREREKSRPDVWLLHDVADIP